MAVPLLIDNPLSLVLCGTADVSPLSLSAGVGPARSCLRDAAPTAVVWGSCLVAATSFSPLTKYALTLTVVALAAAAALTVLAGLADVVAWVVPASLVAGVSAGAVSPVDAGFSAALVEVVTSSPRHRFRRWRLCRALPAGLDSAVRRAFVIPFPIAGEAEASPPNDDHAPRQGHRSPPRMAIVSVLCSRTAVMTDLLTARCECGPLSRDADTVPSRSGNDRVTDDPWGDRAQGDSRRGILGISEEPRQRGEPRRVRFKRMWRAPARRYRAPLILWLILGVFVAVSGCSGPGAEDAATGPSDTHPLEQNVFPSPPGAAVEATVVRVGMVTPLGALTTVERKGRYFVWTRLRWRIRTRLRSGWVRRPCDGTSSCCAPDRSGWSSTWRSAIGSVDSWPTSGREMYSSTDGWPSTGMSGSIHTNRMSSTRRSSKRRSAKPARWVRACGAWPPLPALDRRKSVYRGRRFEVTVLRHRYHVTP